MTILLPRRRDKAADSIVGAANQSLSIAGLWYREAIQSPLAISPRATGEKLKQPMSTTAVDYYESMVFSEGCQIIKSFGQCLKKSNRRKQRKQSGPSFSVFSVPSC
jgi:hypothetical protein